jgi:hypothetical protein
MVKSVRCLIVESDPEARSDLLAHLGVHAEIQVLAAVKTVVEVIPLLSLVPDVFFLDSSTVGFPFRFATEELKRWLNLAGRLSPDVKGRLGGLRLVQHMQRLVHGIKLFKVNSNKVVFAAHG